MNEIDEKIVAILNQDARAPHAQIAEEIRLSRPAVTERVKKLEQCGIIKGYSAIVNPDAVGRSVTAFISAKLPGIVDDKTKQALIDLARREEVLEIHSVAGEDCFLIKVRTDKIGSLNRIVNEFKEPPLGMTTRTTIVLESYFEKVGGITLTRESQFSGGL